MKRAALITNRVSHLMGEMVTVCVTSVPMTRDGFHSQISVQGPLQCRLDAESGDKYRVLVSDSTYVYFDQEDIDSVISPVEGTRLSPFKHGSVAVIFLNIKEKKSE